VTIEGNTAISFTEDVARRFEAYKWHVQRVTDGNDLDAIQKAVEKARAEIQKPSLIILRTHIAYGSPHKQDTCEAHGAPLGEEEVLPDPTSRSLSHYVESACLVPDHFYTRPVPPLPGISGEEGEGVFGLPDPRGSVIVFSPRSAVFSENACVSAPPAATMNSSRHPESTLRPKGGQ